MRIWSDIPKKSLIENFIFCAVLLRPLPIFETKEYLYFANFQCVKSIRIWNYSGPHSPAFELNTERCGKMRTRITPDEDTFYAVFVPVVQK